MEASSPKQNKSQIGGGSLKHGFTDMVRNERIESQGERLTGTSNLANLEAIEVYYGQDNIHIDQKA